MAKSPASEATTREEFVTLLRRQRLARGLTQTKLAKKLGLKSPSTVSFWESGETIPNPELIPKLARLLGVTSIDLTRMLEPEDQPAVR